MPYCKCDNPKCEYIADVPYTDQQCPKCKQGTMREMTREELTKELRQAFSHLIQRELREPFEKLKKQVNELDRKVDDLKKKVNQLAKSIG